MADKIKAYCKRPGKAPETVVVTLSIAGFEKYVERDFDQHNISQDCAVIHTKADAFMGLPYNCNVYGTKFYGNILFVGIKGKSFADVPIDCADFKRLFKNLWEV